MPSRLTEQEFVAHMFAPLDGPNAAAALQQMRDLWDNCQSQLGMSRPIVEAGLGNRLPADPRAEPDGALAGMQDATVDFQAIARREHDVLNFSLVMATPLAAPRRRTSLGSAVPPGWFEFARWWRMLTAAGTGALLGTAVVYQAKARKAASADVRLDLPPQDDDAAGWWTRRHTVEDFAVWEATPGGDRAARRLVVLARPDEDARLSRFTWSAGDVALPPLGRYVMHAAKLRYHARVRGDGRELTRVRDRAADRLDRLTDLLRDPASASQAGAEMGELAADEAALAGTLEALRQMRRSVKIARGNMASALPEPLPSDTALADWLARQLVDDSKYLEATRERAGQLRTIAGFPILTAPATSALPDAPRSEPAPPRDARVEQRLAFGVDVVGYSSRTTPQQTVVQERLAGVVERVLAGIDLRPHDTDRQDAGDGMMVVLPPVVEPHRILSRLLHGWRAQVVADNAEHPDDRIRLRMSVGTGPFTNAAIGFSGNTIIEVGRLLDSAALRGAMLAHPDADLVAIVSDRLYQDVVGEGYPGLEDAQFEPRLVEAKTYRKRAWLWFGATASPSPGPSAQAPQEPSHREVFVIHGRDKQARDAVNGLLRDLDLRPLDWEEIIARTGEPTPFVRDVFDQAFADNQAAIVLITPDDIVGVLFKAGMAVALQRGRTVIVEIGAVPPIVELAGLDVVRISAEPGTQARGMARIVQRLRNAGCAVNDEGTQWLNLDRFAGLDAYTRGFDPPRSAGPDDQAADEPGGDARRQE